MKYTWLLDAGHGGVVDGVYKTSPNYDKNNHKTWHKMWIHDDIPIYEGEFNRQIVDLIAYNLSKLGVDYIVIVPECEDVPLSKRVYRANNIHSTKRNCIFVSIHGNAFNGNAQGFEVFTSKGDTPADPVAEVFAEEMEKMFPEEVMRWDLTDGDKDKEAGFYVLKNTSMPAILTENFFFDKAEQAELMMSPEGQERIAQAHVNAILRIENDS